MWFLLHFYVCTSPEARAEEVAVRHIVTEICQTPLSFALSVSHSISVCLSFSHSLSVACIYIYNSSHFRTVCDSHTETSAGWNLPAIVTIVLEKNCDLFLCNFSGCAHINSCAARLHTSTYSKNQLMQTHTQSKLEQKVLSCPRQHTNGTFFLSFFIKMLKLYQNIVGFAQNLSSSLPCVQSRVQYFAIPLK